MIVFYPMLLLRLFPPVSVWVFGVLPNTAWSIEGKAVDVHASVDVSRDDNLFRLPSGGSNATGRSDTIISTGVGLDINKQLGLQQFIGRLNVNDVKFRQHDYLDFRAVNFDAAYRWAVGARSTGEVVASRAESLASFGDYRNFSQRNLRVTETQGVNVDHWFHSNWHAIAGASHLALANERVFQEDSDFESTGYYLGLSYRPRSGSSLTWRMKRSDGKYQKRLLNSGDQLDNRFSDTGNEVGMLWQLSGKSTLSGRIEYVKREHEHFPTRDFDGWAGNLSYLYNLGGKTTHTVTYARNLAAFQDRASSFYVSDGVKVSSQWAATSKLTASVGFGYGKRRFLGGIDSSVANADRRDDLTQAGVQMKYKASRWADLTAAAAVERRSSSFADFDYYDRSVSFSVSARF